MGKTLSKSLRMMGKIRHMNQVDAIRDNVAPRSKTWGGKDDIRKDRRNVDKQLRRWEDV